MMILPNTTLAQFRNHYLKDNLNRIQAWLLSVAYLNLLGVDPDTLNTEFYPAFTWIVLGHFSQSTLANQLLTIGFAGWKYNTSDLELSNRYESPEQIFFEKNQAAIVSKTSEEIHKNRELLLTRLRELSTPFSYKQFQLNQGKLGTQKVCARCHGEGISGAPTLDFLNLSLVHKQEAIARIQSKDSEYKMPPDQPLTQEQKQILVQFISAK